MGQTGGVARPRDPVLDARILRATRELIDEVGVGEVTIAAVAARAGVSRPTVYRRWANRAVLVFAAETHASVDIEFPDQGGFRERLGAALEHLVEVMWTSDRAFMSEQFARMIVDPQFATEVWAQRWGPDREQVYSLWEQAIAEGEVEATTDGRAVLDDLVAICLFHVFLGHRRPDVDEIGALVERVLGGVSKRPSG